MIIIDNKHEIGDKVYLISDEDQKVRIVASIRIFKGGEILYSLVCATIASEHYGFEISEEKNLILT